MRRAVKRVLLRQTNVVTDWAYWRQASRLPDGRPGSLLPGASLLGCSRAENGIGESCRLATAALAESGVPDSEPMPRSDLGLRDDAYVFFFMYDVASYQERKNPEGAILAFQRAFRPESHATLVVKLNNVHFRPEKASFLEALAAGWPNIRFMKQPLDRGQVAALMRA